jgi:hypothetical protein
MDPFYYPAAGIVSYEVARSDDSLLPSLLLMEQDDHEFEQLLLSNDHLQEVYTMELENEQKALKLRLGIMLIVHALKNRTRFAIQQKERLKYHVNLLRPPDLKRRVIREVNSDLERVIALITPFTEYDQGLHDMADEAGRCMNDNLAVVYGYPALILPPVILSTVGAVGSSIVIKMDPPVYPVAGIVSYEVARNDDLLLPSLLMMEQDDHEFEQL